MHRHGESSLDIEKNVGGWYAFYGSRQVQKTPQREGFGLREERAETNPMAALESISEVGGPSVMMLWRQGIP